MRVHQILLAVAAAALLATGSAQAAEVMFTGSGTYTSTADSSPVSAANETWSFSFIVDNPMPVSVSSSGSLVSSTDVSSFNFDLNGSPVDQNQSDPGSDPMSSIVFYTVAEGSGFDINFNDGTTFSTYDTIDFGSDGNVTSPSGPTSVDVDIDYDTILNGAALQGSGNVSISDVVTTAPGGVPEPQSWALMIVGVGLAGAALRRRAAVST